MVSERSRQYDLLNRMTEAAAPEDVSDLVNNLTTINENIYNTMEACGKDGIPIRRSWQFDQQDVEVFLYGECNLYTQNGSGALRTENVLDPSGTIVASKRFDDDNDPNTEYELQDMHMFYHYDIRGSVTNIVRPDGKLIEGYTYDEFGNKQTTEYDENGNPITNPNDEVFENEVTFTSSITDTSTGLQYMNARYYDSTTGRFITQDTYSGNAYEPWTQHLYSYCGNNPVNMIDPTGHYGESYYKQKIQAAQNRISELQKYQESMRKTLSSSYLPSSERSRIKEGIIKASREIGSMQTNIGRYQQELAAVQSSKKNKVLSDSQTAVIDAFDSLAIFYENNGESQKAIDIDYAERNLVEYWPNTYEVNGGNTYYDINYYVEPSTADKIISYVLTYPTDGVSMFFTSLQVAGYVFEGRDFNPQATLVTGDVTIYVSPDNNENFAGKETVPIQYDCFGAYGIEYAFRGSNMIYYKNNWNNDVIWKY